VERRCRGRRRLRREEGGDGLVREAGIEGGGRIERRAVGPGRPRLSAVGRGGGEGGSGGRAGEREGGREGGSDTGRARGGSDTGPTTISFGFF
jgi:hypothetical protein